MGFLTLSWPGVTAAVFLGLLLLFLGGPLGYVMLAVMLYFLSISAIVTNIGIDYKNKARLAQRSRGVLNVMANGGVPALFAILFFFGSYSGNMLPMAYGFFGFFSAVAAALADKFGSELGVLDGVPRMLLTLKPVKKGTNGGVTAFGLAGGVIASFLVAILILPASGYGFGLVFPALTPLVSLYIIMLAGFAGTLTDSAFGYFEEGGLGNKFTSNIAGALVAGLIGIALVSLLA